MAAQKCPRCGSGVPSGSGRGRPRVWCSTACRRAASIERQAAEREGGAVQVVVVPRPPTRREDANAVAALLDELAGTLEQGRELPRQVRKAMDGLTTAVLAESDEPWEFNRMVPPVVRRNRAKARERMRKLRARRATETPKPKQPPPPLDIDAYAKKVYEGRRVDLDAVELFIDEATSHIRAGQLGDDLVTTYERLTVATGRMVEAAKERHSTAPPEPATAPPPMNRAQRRQAQRREGR